MPFFIREQFFGSANHHNIGLVINRVDTGEILSRITFGQQKTTFARVILAKIVGGGNRRGQDLFWLG